MTSQGDGLYDLYEDPYPDSDAETETEDEDYEEDGLSLDNNDSDAETEDEDEDELDFLLDDDALGDNHNLGGGGGVHPFVHYMKTGDLSHFDDACEAGLRVAIETYIVAHRDFTNLRCTAGVFALMALLNAPPYQYALPVSQLISDPQSDLTQAERNALKVLVEESEVFV